MRARICSAFSCDMFARVVWLRLRRAAKPPTFDLSLAAHTCHAWLARLTRARGGCFLRGRKALLNDFCRALVIQKREKRKIFLMPLCGRTLFAPTRESKSRQQPKEKIYPLFRQRTYHIHARLALSAGVQTMRARICSVFSCNMFARVV